MIVISNSLVLTAAETVDARNPVIGWDNVVLTTNVTATTAAAGYPATNVANPATHLFWRGGVNPSDEYLTVTTGSLDLIDYLAVARHNFGSAGIAVSVEGTGGAPTSANIVSLLHFDGADASATFTDATARHIWTPAGNAQIDTAQSKFGGASGLFDGTGDYVTSDGDVADFTFGTGDFTIDFWVRIAVAGTLQTYVDFRPVGGGGQPVIYKSAANKIVFYVSGDQIVGATSLTTGQWYHVALTRSGTSTRLFLDGVQQGSTYIDSNNYSIGSGRPVIGSNGDTLGNNAHNGWIDELRIVKGSALWTAGFTPPVAAADSWALLVQAVQLGDDAPVLFRFTPQALTKIRLRMQPGAAAPEASVLYVGKLIVLERSIRIDTNHTPFNLGQVTKIATGKSENGHFLGRTVLNRKSVSQADFEWFNADWYRTNLQPFVVGAQEDPFFFAWNPSEYPLEVGYAWLADDARPEIDPVTRRVAISLKMEGLVA